MLLKLHFAHYAVNRVVLIYLSKWHTIYVSNVIMWFTEKNFSSFWIQLQLYPHLVRLI